MKTNPVDAGKFHVLVIMLHWYPYEGPLMPIYGRIFKALMDRGHRVTIVTSFPHFRKGRKETWEEYRGKFIEVTSWEQARVIRCYVFAPIFDENKPGLLYRALNFLSFNISCMISAVFAGGKADLVFAPSSPPLTNGICAWVVSVLKRCSVIYNVQDMYPDMAEKIGVVRSGILLQLMKMVEKAVYKISYNVLLLTEGMRKNVINKGVLDHKTKVIPNFMDATHIVPLSKRNRFSEKWGLAHRFVVMYAGNIGLPHGTEVIIETADMLKSNPDILFCFVGRGEHKDTIEKLAHKRKLKNIIFVPPQPEEEVPYIWASGDAALITYRKGLADFSVPSKLLAAMLSARPVIAAIDAGSETFKIIKNAKCGLITPPEKPQALVKSILYLYRRNERCTKMGLAGRKYAETHFSKDSIVNAYEALFLDVAGVGTGKRRETIS
jgi:colanic acid biosynthesis glycosyl transferase WcaI